MDNLVTLYHGGSIESSDDEDTSYDLATRAGTQVDSAPILDQVVMWTLNICFQSQRIKTVIALILAI
jgi:hypothetical protein